MSKQATTTVTYKIGDRVTATTAATLDKPAIGTVSGISKGWYVITLESPELFPGCSGGKVSARVSSINPLFGTSDGEAGDETSTNEPAPLPEAEEALDEAEEHASKMAEALRKARARYTKARRPSGAATAHNGDTIAKELLDYEPLEVAAIADRCLNLPKGTHAAKYAHLNNGQIRMNSGNKIRGAWKKAEKDGDTKTLERIRFVLGLDAEDEELASIEDRGPEGIEDLQPVEE